MTLGSRLNFQACSRFLFACFLRQGCCFPPTSSSPKKWRRKNTEKKPNETNWFHRQGLVNWCFFKFQASDTHLANSASLWLFLGWRVKIVILSMGEWLESPWQCWNFFTPEKAAFVMQQRSEASFGSSVAEAWGGCLNLGCNKWNPRFFSMS